VSQEEAQEIDSRIAQKLLKEKKLALVLDLDHTLIHAAVETDLPTIPPSETDDIHSFHLQPSEARYWVKLR
jgi:TFIIF-interacting CTD phosphatase-like protein